MKTCAACKLEKPEDDFPFKRKIIGLRQSKCRVCYTEYNRTYYKNSDEQREKQRHRIRVNKRKTRIKYSEWKQNQRCLHCGEDSPECLDLHHLDPTVKEDSLSRMVQSYTWGRIERELAKCVVICANCHRKVHSGRLLLPLVA